MIKMKIVRNVILNNIDLNDQPSIDQFIVLPPGVAKISQIQKIQRFDKSDTNISDLI